MASALFRLRLPDGRERLARGDPERGPNEMLEEEWSLDSLLGEGRTPIEELFAGTGAAETVPAGSRILAPIGSQEVWAAGVTYLRSRDARIEESMDASPYDRVYVAERPELFFKASGWRVRGPGEAITVRRDSSWNVPEPELVLVLDADMRIVAYTIGNDVSSRSIEGENTLYLPQAKVYDGSCALGPCLVSAIQLSRPFHIAMEIRRDGRCIYEGKTSTEMMKRSFEDLASYLGRALSFPNGAFLLTGTALVPDQPFTLTPGDVVRICIDGLGCLENPVTEVKATW
jgi:2-dehydro-3-deoxy-D-arabinonate dehydratase